jgi:hypothetical protein
MNILKLPLLIVINVLNINKTFLVAFLLLGHGYAKQHAAPAKHMLGAGLTRAPS